MKKRIIDDHTIKVFITKNDLKRNGLTALDLLGDHNQIETFFYKILNKVDTKHLFMPHEPLTFRVLPNQNGLNIIITRHKRSKMASRPKKILNKPFHQSLGDKVIQLNRFENFIQISRILKLNHVASRLYRYKNKYYLELDFNYDLMRSQIDQIKNQLAIAYEYGDPTIITPNKLRVNGKLIMKDHALEKGRYYFR